MEPTAGEILQRKPDSDSPRISKMNPDTKITDSDRLRWLHTGSGRDAEGFEWGIFRVKWDAQGQPVEVWQTNSDFSDLDAEMLREAASQNT